MPRGPERARRILQTGTFYKPELVYKRGPVPITSGSLPSLRSLHRGARRLFSRGRATRRLLMAVTSKAGYSPNVCSAFSKRWSKRRAASSGRPFRSRPRGTAREGFPCSLKGSMGGWVVMVLLRSRSEKRRWKAVSCASEECVSEEPRAGSSPMARDCSGVGPTGACRPVPTLSQNCTAPSGARRRPAGVALRPVLRTGGPVAAIAEATGSVAVAENITDARLLGSAV